MSRPKPQYHSTYKNYEIYYRENIKRRPWLVLIYPDRDVGRFAAKCGLAACYNLINRLTQKGEQSMSNTKARHQEIYNASVESLDKAGGVEAIDELSQDERIPKLRQMAKDVVNRTDCHIDSAKRNIAKAMRRARFGIMKEKWGGHRNPPGGRPPISN